MSRNTVRVDLGDPRIAIAQDLLARNQGLRIGALAEAVNLSPSTLEHLFRVETGMTITRYRSCAQLGKAARWLRTGTEQVKEVALELGFRHPSSFTRAFRRQFGMSPQAYRRVNGRLG